MPYLKFSIQYFNRKVQFLRFNVKLPGCTTCQPDQDELKVTPGSTALAILEVFLCLEILLCQILSEVSSCHLCCCRRSSSILNLASAAAVVEPRRGGQPPQPVIGLALALDLAQPKNHQFTLLQPSQYHITIESV